MKFCLGVIATNEEKMLSRFLPQLSEEFKGEVVAIDYNSTDKTNEVLKKYCKCVQKREWPNDFGQAKTNLIRFAENQNYDWIFVIDADETIEPGGVQVLRHIIEENPHTAYFTPRLNFNSDDTYEGFIETFLDPQARLFKLNEGYSYLGKRHCSLAKNGEIVWNTKGAPALPVFIYHYKRMKPVDELNKAEADRQPLMDIAPITDWKLKMPVKI